MSGLEIIVGTYEEYTAGYKIEPMRTDPSRQYLKEVFSTHNHTASVRVLASHGKYLASGGADDRICIFDLETGSLKDELLHHNGTVNCLTFSPDGSYLFSGSHDGTISAINVKKLTVEKTWKNAHKSAVLCITIHPVGKLALSLGADMNLRTWDLITGRTIYTRGLRNDPKFSGYLSWVEWSPDGSHFALMGNRVVDIVSIETTKSTRIVECPSKPVSICWISETEVAVGLDDGHLLMFNVTDEGEPEKIRAYESRLKAIAVVGDHLATASSSGDISLWTIDGREFRELCTTNIGCRPTCLVLVEADRLGLHKYVKQQEDNKDELRQQLKRIHSIGKVTVEHEDTVKRAGGKKSKKQLKRKGSAVEEPAEFSTPLSKKKKALTEENVKPQSSPVVKSSAKKSNKKKKANQSAIGLWEEEDITPESPEVVANGVGKKKLKKKLGQGLNKSNAGFSQPGETKLKKDKMRRSL